MRFVEEILLLLLRNEGGKFVAVPGIALDNALVAEPGGKAPPYTSAPSQDTPN